MLPPGWRGPGGGGVSAADALIPLFRVFWYFLPTSCERCDIVARGDGYHYCDWSHLDFNNEDTYEALQKAFPGRQQDPSYGLAYSVQYNLDKLQCRIAIEHQLSALIEESM